MNQQKGFSLVEVLASLLVLTTLALSLLQQQFQSKQLITQIIIRQQGSQLLDQLDERIRFHAGHNFSIATPLNWNIKLLNTGILLTISGPQGRKLISSRYYCKGLFIK